MDSREYDLEALLEALLNYEDALKASELEIYGLRDALVNERRFKEEMQFERDDCLQLIKELEEAVTDLDDQLQIANRRPEKYDNYKRDILCEHENESQNFQNLLHKNRKLSMKCKYQATQIEEYEDLIKQQQKQINSLENLINEQQAEIVGLGSQLTELDSAYSSRAIIDKSALDSSKVINNISMNTASRESASSTCISSPKRISDWKKVKTVSPINVIKTRKGVQDFNGHVRDYSDGVEQSSSFDFEDTSFRRHAERGAPAMIRKTVLRQLSPCVNSTPKASASPSSSDSLSSLTSPERLKGSQYHSASGTDFEEDVARVRPKTRNMPQPPPPPPSYSEWTVSIDGGDKSEYCSASDDHGGSWATRIRFPGSVRRLMSQVIVIESCK